MYMHVSFSRLRPSAEIPHYQTIGSAAADVAACINEPIIVRPGERVIVPTGLAIAIPAGYEGQIRARSGLSLKHGICLANGIGTIDADYRGEVGVILLNVSDTLFTVEPGMRIAQLAIVKVEQAEWRMVPELDDTERGKGGYGSTGH